MDYPLIEFGGAGETLHFAVANGFPPGVYTPLLMPFTGQYRVISLPPRALWGSPPPAEQVNWRDSVTRDLLDGLRHHNLRNVIAVGHSFGGIASMLAVLAEPERFKALILLDPTILSHEVIAGLEALKAQDAMDQMPLAARALKRRRDFASHDEAFDYFRVRSLFADWDDAALKLYVQHGTRASEGGGVTLTWTPEWEAYYFMNGYTGIWSDLPALDGQVPTLIIRGAESDTFIASSAEEVRRLLPSAHYAEVAGHGHLFPMSNPAETGRLMKSFLDAL